MRITRRAAAATGLLLCLVASEALAVFTFTPLIAFRRITLRVGSAGGTIDTVTFNVTGANISPSPTPVTGVASGPATSPAGGVEVNMSAELPSPGNQTQITLNVDSSAGLTCVGGTGCGSTVIPFTTISWTSANRDTTYPGLDIGPGTFTGGTQSLVNFFVTGGSINMSNVLTFTYNNATIYPAGQYTGRVVYTAAMP